MTNTTTTFTPYLYVSIGQTGAMFTLRQTYLETVVVDGHNTVVVRSFHMSTLGTDEERARAKAERLSHEYGLPLRNPDEKLAQELREIIRRSPEVLERERVMMEMALKEEAQRQLELFAEAQAKKVEMLLEGKSPFSRNSYYGKRFDEMDPKYVSWLINARSTFEPWSIIAIASAVAEQQCPHLKVEELDPVATLGEPGQRLEITAKVIRTGSYESTFGRVYVTTFATPDRVCLVCRSTSFTAQVGETLTFKATIKKHGEYKGQAQTEIQRITIK